ncbi:MAG: hypothetical protein AABX74_05025 [Nanoarchaeota archaeon]
MKIISLEIKKIGIGRFFPKENKVELDLLFNDGSDKEIFKTIDVSDAEGSAENILADLRKMEKSIHKNSEADSPIVDNFINIVVKNENETIKDIARFIQKIEIKMEEIKSRNVAEGHLERIRQLKSLKVDFT